MLDSVSIMLNRLASALLTPALVAASALAVGACGGGGSSGPDATLTVTNSSDFALTEIYLTDVGNSSWGPNLISGDVLLPDEHLTLGVNCSTYDALIVDESGVDCEVDNIDLCLNNADWVITNSTCPVFGVAKELRDSAAKAQDATSQLER